MQVVIQKNQLTEVHVSLSEFRGEQRLDVREFLDLKGSGEHQPTRKGVNLPIGQLPQLRAALQDLEADALRRGLLVLEDYPVELGIEPLTPLMTESV